MNTAEKEDSPLGIYISAALGALFLGIGDLLNNGDAATVNKLTETLRHNFFPSLDWGGWVALLSLAILGAAICWVQQPHTRIDAFARGFSVFAVMAVTAPYNPPDSGLTHPLPDASPGISSLFGLSVANAAEDITNQRVDITLEPQTPSRLPADTRVTIRERDTGRIVGASAVHSTSFTVQQPSGRYLLEVEAPGLRRTVTEFQIDATSQKISIPLEDSSIPLGIQRLYAPQMKSAQQR